MKAHKNWNYSPYQPLFFDVGDIYICRVVPYKTSIHFEWLNEENLSDFHIYYRERGTEEWILAGTTDGTEYDIKSLKTETDYEFYVAASDKKSRTRLARCGKSFDTVVNYLHPDDDCYSFSGNYLCSPSLLRHPNGYLLASMDLYGLNTPQNLTLIFRSDDEGKTWHYVSELFPCFWGKLFLYQNELYVLGCSTEYGDILIGKSTDGGKTFTEPSVLFRGSNGKNGEIGCHKNPQPLVEFGGRIWSTFEYGSWGKKFHSVSVMSAPIGCDLLDADNWLFSEPVHYNPDWEGLPKGVSTGNIEGSLVVKDAELYSFMRYDMTQMTPTFGYIIAYKVDTENPENPLTFHKCIPFPGNQSKFMIKYDEKTKKYYSIICRITDGNIPRARNLLSFIASDDLENWYVVKDLADMRDQDPLKVGLQYVDFTIEGNKIIYLCRTAMNGAAGYHDSNYSTFGTIEIET